MSAARKPLLRLAQDNSGSSAVEFALISSVFITFIFGIAYSAIMLYDRATLQWAVEESIRSATINTSISQSQMNTVVNGYLSSVGLPTASVAYSVSSVSGIPVASLSASFSRSYTMPFVRTFNITYSASTSMPQGG